MRRGLVAAVSTLRRNGGSDPDPDGPPDELEAYALRLRTQFEELAVRLPAPRGSYAWETRDGPVPGLWVIDERQVPDGAPLTTPLEPTATALDGAPRVTIHLHGGAYVMGSPRTHRGMAGALSRTTRGPVFLPDYRLAPEHRFPAALDDALATYRWLVDDRGVDPATIAITGDSAGGGLGVALLVRLRDEGGPLPACYAGMSPWTDLAGTGPSLIALDHVDPWLSAAMVVPAARAYAGDQPLDDPYISPLYADLTGLPPMLVHVGSDEILLDDALRLVERARGYGIDASVGRFEGLWHVFHAFPGVPESRHALREIGGFVRRHTGARVGAR
jgi:epsilon-lactone hydrolase